MSLDFYVKKNREKNEPVLEKGVNWLWRPGKVQWLGRAMFLLGSLIILYLLWTFLSYQDQILRLEKKIDNLSILGESQTKAIVPTLGIFINRSSFGSLLPTSGLGAADPGLTVDSKTLQGDSGYLGLTNNDVNVPSEFTLSIPTIGIDKAKVRTNVDGADKVQYLSVLKEAIAHFKGTALPGENGTVFLFGHSMIPVLAHGQYEAIFTDLLKIKKDDLVTVNYKGEDYNYQIIETKPNVDPADVSVLYQPLNDKLIALMTCIPPGFGTKRFVAIGRLVN